MHRGDCTAQPRVKTKVALCVFMSTIDGVGRSVGGETLLCGHRSADGAFKVLTVLFSGGVQRHFQFVHLPVICTYMLQVHQHSTPAQEKQHNLFE